MTVSQWSDIIQAAGIAVAAIIGAWTAWQGNQIKKLRTELDDLKASFADQNKKFRSAINHIREWMRWEMKAEPKGPAPTLPDELVDEV